MRKILLMLLSFSYFVFSQSEADLDNSGSDTANNNKFFLKTGIGIGAAYGGWFGTGVEVGYSIISISEAFGGIFPCLKWIYD